MAKIKEQIVRIIQSNAGRKATDFARQFVRAAPEEKELILAALDFERWLQQCCQECLNGQQMLK